MLNVTDAIFGDVLIAVPGAPDITVERAIARATRQFCNETHVWRHTTWPLPVAAGRREVDLDLPRGAVVVRPYWVTLDSKPLLGISASRIDTEEGTPTGYAISPSNVLMLDRPPTESYRNNGVTAHLALAPKRDSVEIPDHLEIFLDTIQSLAESILLSMPGVDWRDRHAAADASSLYMSQLQAAKRYGNQQNQTIHRTVKYGGL